MARWQIPPALLPMAPPGFMVMDVRYLIPAPSFTSGSVAPSSRPSQVPASPSIARSTAHFQPQGEAGLNPDMATWQWGDYFAEFSHQLVVRRARQHRLSRPPSASNNPKPYAASSPAPPSIALQVSTISFTSGSSAHLQPQSGAGHNLYITTRKAGHPYHSAARQARQKQLSKSRPTPMTSSTSAFKPVPPNVALQVPAMSSTAGSTALLQPQFVVGPKTDMATLLGGHPYLLARQQQPSKPHLDPFLTPMSPTVTSSASSVKPVPPSIYSTAGSSAHLQPQSVVGPNPGMATHLGGHPYLLARQQQHSKPHMDPFLTPMSPTVTSSASSVKPAHLQPQSGVGPNPDMPTHLGGHPYLLERQQQRSKPHTVHHFPKPHTSSASSVKPDVTRLLELKHISREIWWEHLCKIQEGNFVKCIASANCPLCGDVKKART